MEFKINLDNTYMNIIKFGKGDKNLVIIAGVSLLGLEGLGDALETALSDFANNFTVYVFDRRKVLLTGHTIADMANDVYACLTELGVDHASVYGASQGGMIAQTLAIKHPELVDNLIICSSMSRTTHANHNILNQWLKAAKAHDVEGLNMLFLKHVYSQAYVDSIKDSIPTIIKNGTDADCDRFAIEIEAAMSFDVYNSLNKIKCPTFVICDKNDQIFSYECSKEIVDKLNCNTYIYDKYSHAVYDEAPDFQMRIIDFIKNTPR